MLALSAVGRQADALAVYREGRRIYAEELGIEPGAALQELHQRVLAGDLALTGPEDRPGHPGPLAAPGDQRLHRPAGDGGPAGQGDRGGRRPDPAHRRDGRQRQDHARGARGDRPRRPLPRRAALHRPARAQRTQPADARPRRWPPCCASSACRRSGCPIDPDDRLALWRTELAGRRALVVLDNAASADQVAPLLPNGPDCLVLITSRRRLVGLDEGRPSSLPVLDADEAVELLGRVAGVGPGGRRAGGGRRGGAPLRPPAAGHPAGRRPAGAPAPLADRRPGRAAGRRARPAGRARRRASVRWGRRSPCRTPRSSPPAQRLFRLLGLHPGVRFDNRVAAALAELPLPEAQDLLDELVDAHLVEEAEPGRYRLHDLIREYARTLLAEPERAVERRAGLERLLDHHLHVAAAIARDDRARAGSRSILALAEPARPDLVAAPLHRAAPGSTRTGPRWPPWCAWPRPRGSSRHCWQLARACWRPIFDGGHLDELIETHTVGLRAAERLGDDGGGGDDAQLPRVGVLPAGPLPGGDPADGGGARPAPPARAAPRGPQARSGTWAPRTPPTGTTGGGMENFDAALAMMRGAGGRHELTDLLNNMSFALLLLGSVRRGAALPAGSSAAGPADAATCARWRTRSGTWG